MKKIGILHSELMKEIASLAHMEKFMISDAGMPIPPGVKVIDLALCPGSVDFETTLRSILEEVEVEFFYIADETSTKSIEKKALIDELLPKCEHTVMDHTDLKDLSSECKFAIRTGEFTPFANIILRAGVVF